MIRLPFFDTLKCATRSQKFLWTCQVANLLVVLRVGTVVVAVGPEPQLNQKLIERGIQRESHSHSYSKNSKIQMPALISCLRIGVEGVS